MFGNLLRIESASMPIFRRAGGSSGGAALRPRADPADHRECGDHDQDDAREALDMGLVNKVVPLESLEETYVEWANKILAKSPLALRMLKSSFNAELDGQAGIQELAGNATLLYYLSDEAKEGKNAFLEKRDPDWSKYPKFP